MRRGTQTASQVGCGLLCGPLEEAALHSAHWTGGGDKQGPPPPTAVSLLSLLGAPYGEASEIWGENVLLGISSCPLM